MNSKFTPGFLFYCGKEVDISVATEQAWRDGTTAIQIRGNKCRTLGAMWDEFAAALQFPWYFGENWAAFDECLSDIDVIAPNKQLVITVLRSQEVLIDDHPADFAVLVRSLNDAVTIYSSEIHLGQLWDRPAIPMTVILQSPSSTAEACRARWEAAGATVRDLILESGP